MDAYVLEKSNFAPGFLQVQSFPSSVAQRADGEAEPIDN